MDRLNQVSMKTQKHVNNHLGNKKNQFTITSKTPAVSISSSPGIPVDQLYTPSVVQVKPMHQQQFGIKLRSVTEIPQKYRQIFRFPNFNMVQSKVFDDVIYTDKSLVLCSPTGSGKTAVFEMAIMRLLSTTNATNLKVVYMAPIKALCSERFTDWKEKFEPYNLKVMELTGDTDNDDFFELQRVNIILTTPEKWDSMTRKWRDNKAVVQTICLFLVDEIHVLNDATRGAVVEAVLSRMKTIQAARQRTGTNKDLPSLRFVALSATITNIEDVARWLGTEKSSALHFKFDDNARPVRLRKVVLGYHFSEGKRSEFQFDISLSYKLAGIINTYNENKPSLIFCATRKGVMQAADILAKDVKSSYLKSSKHRLTLQNHSFHLKDTKLRDLVSLGIGYHHAGMDIQDRKAIEEIFANGDLPVLVATSTLAMGVNLPAHLVIIKSTMYYNMGTLQEYSDTQVLQMIGRAGRPQFDTSATAVIMTKNSTKTKYENLINGTQLIESSLHKNLVEHLNAEIVLNTITDISVAVEWLKYTFLYIRVMKNPIHYGIPSGLAKVAIDKRLQDLCMKSLNQLNHLKLIDMNGDNLDITSTGSGRLMARYCISFKTAELFLGLKGDESICDLISMISKCEEFEDIKLRVSEKSSLNSLNKDKNRITIRYPMTGKIKTTDMKVNCLIQATLGCLLVHDFALQQDTTRIFKAGTRVTRCLVELVSQKKNYRATLSALLLCKCFKARLWENSKYVSKQLDGIGPTLSTALVNAGLTNFEKIELTNPREIELIVNRHPPFGNQVKDSISKLPKYEMTIEQIARYSIDKADIVITVVLTNKDFLKEAGCTSHACSLLVGDEDNVTLYKQRIMDAVLIKDGLWTKKLEIKLAVKGPLLNIHYISQDFVGLDVECTYTPYYLAGFKVASSAMNGYQQPNAATQPKTLNTTNSQRQPCNHSCHNKMMCAHECCKSGVSSKRRKQQTEATSKPAMSKSVARHIEEIKKKASSLTDTPTISKKIKLMERNTCETVDLTKFSYVPRSYNMIDSMYSDQPINVEDYQYNECTNDDCGYDNTAIKTMMSEPIALCNNKTTKYLLADKQLQDGNEDNISYGKVLNKKSDPEVNKSLNRDWDKLDMYIKNRENIKINEETDDPEAAESCPYIEQISQIQSDQDTAWAGEPTECDTFAQETEYGLVYVQAGHQDTNPALLNYNDDQWQENPDNRNGKSSKTRDNLQFQQRMNKKSTYEPSRVLSDMHHLNSRHGDLKYGSNNSDVDYEIDEFSDESIDAIERSELNIMDETLTETKENDAHFKDIDCTYMYYDNVQGNNESQCYGDIDNEPQLYAKPLVNNFRQNKSTYTFTSKPYHNSDRGTVQCQQNRSNTPIQNSHNTEITKAENIYCVNAPVSRGLQKHVLNSWTNDDNDRNRNTAAPTLHDSKNAESESKWTNFFSSQSSTASDCVNMKYPSKYDKNEMAMKNWNCSLPEALNIPRNKCKQVHPPASNQNHSKYSLDELNGMNESIDDVKLHSRSLSGYPDYSNIFEGIL